jgi:tRNA (cytidine/uridine-2'-O-)-methyltransferase
MNVVLVEPEIPGNTGNIGRSCVGNGTTLHLVGKLGFSLSDKYLKRSGLDYWKDVDLRLHESWEKFLETVPDREQLFFFEKDAPGVFWDAKFTKNCYLIFGSETRGFPDGILSTFKDRFHRIPMTGPIRSLNLSSTVAVALYEALRQTERC